MTHRRSLILSLAVMTAAACNAQPAAEAASQNAAATADVAAVAADDAEPAAGSDPIMGADEAVQAVQKSSIQMAGVMTAAVEACGLSKPGDADKALQGLQDSMASSGVSKAQIKRMFDQAYEAGKLKAASASAAEKARGCESLRKMSDPETLRQLNEMAAKAEAAAKG